MYNKDERGGEKLVSVKVIATTKDAYELIHKGILALARAERYGIRIDTEYCQKQRQRLTRRIEYYKKKLQATKFHRRWEHIYGSKTNIYSNHQPLNILYNHM